MTQPTRASTCTRNSTNCSAPLHPTESTTRGREWEQGESWVDAYNVPVTADALDKIAWTGDPAVRAMLTFGPEHACSR
jgi:hypothetical protein